MSLKLRGDVWHFRKMINGHIVARSTKTSDRKLAEQIAIKWEHEALKSIQFNDEKPQTLHLAIRAFLAARKGTGGYENAQTHFKQWIKLPNVPLNEIKLYQVQELVAERRAAGKAHNTISVMIGYWNALMNFCSENGWVSGVKLPGQPPLRTRLRVLSKEEEARLYAAIDPAVKFPGRNPINVGQRQDNVDLMIALISLGARLNEVQKLRWSQVDFDNNLIHVIRSKNGVDSPVAMTLKLRAVMERRVIEHAECGYVFPTKAKGKTNTNWIRDAVKRAGIDETLGKVTLHTMRHCVATRLLRGGMSLPEVQNILGHKNIQSTMIYSHIHASSAVVRAAAVLDEL